MVETSPRLRLFAAGSLRAAVTDLAQGRDIDLVFGPAGLLRERIEGGDAPDIFLSANTAHPAALAAARGGGATPIFARNTLVAIARRDIGLTTDNFLDRLLAPKLRIGTSTPGLDPSGDYAQLLFARADAIRPGAGAALAGRATALVGGRDHVPSPAGTYPARDFLETGHVDVFLSYRSNARMMADGFDIVEPPEALRVTAEYGLIVLATEMARRTHAEQLVSLLLSMQGQALLARHGFLSPAPSP